MFTITRFAGVTSLSAVMLASTSVLAADTTNTTTNKRLKDDMYVTLHGTVKEVTDKDEFTMNYNGGIIKVDTNDKWPNLFTEGAELVLRPGDAVRVAGEIDDNYFAGKEIEATSLTHDGTNYSRVYWTKDHRYVPHASYDYDNNSLKNDMRISLSGTITQVVNNDEFLLNYGAGNIQVETSDMNFDADKLNVGDVVTVHGTIDEDWFEKKELEADRIYRTTSYYRAG
ncbi:MAG: NirD/YgiW/YdeI family stress tolerance protein [Alphaproteobacteria bacterium]